MGAPDSRIFRVPGGCGGLHSPARARLARATAPPGDPIMYVPKTQEWSRAKRAPDLGPFLLVPLLHFVLSRSVTGKFHQGSTWQKFMFFDVFFVLLQACTLLGFPHEDPSDHSDARAITAPAERPTRACCPRWGCRAPALSPSHTATAKAPS